MMNGLNEGMYIMVFGTAHYLIDWNGLQAVDWIKLF